MSVVISSGGTAAHDRSARRVVIGIRAGVLAICATLALATATATTLTLLLLALCALAVLMSLPPRASFLLRWRPVVEGLAAGVIVGLAPEGADTALLPYLLVAPIAAGVISGFTAVFVTVAATAVSMTLVSRPMTATSRIELAEWIALGLAVGLLGAWARAATRDAFSGSGSYGAANRLLSQLREVARSLPTGLDEVSLAQTVLADLSGVLEFDRGGLFTVSESGYAVPLAFRGAERLDWDPSSGELWSRAHRSGRAEQAAGQFSDPESGSRAAVPLLLADRFVGVIALERAGGAWTRAELARALVLADDAALRLDTGHLFSELRTLATVEERRRLAREIHDGVAQEVAALGFLVDDMSSRTADLALRDDLRDLRAQLTRIVSELRLSIFDLRSEVEPATGLGAALGSYVRQVGTGSGMTVHLVLDEAATRLPVDVETELLRVAQEAVTNARRHSRARNLWVTCRVDPPRAFLRVADDGQGMGQPRHDSYGLEIMRERTARLGAGLSVRNRVGGGTVIEVTLDGAVHRVAPSPTGGREPA